MLDDRIARTLGSMTSSVETFSIPLEAAEAYEEFFVPNMFVRWPAHVLDLADVRAGDSVLDVACGTGIVARGAADRVGPSGSVTGVDLNENMLIVARRVRPDLTWQQGDVAALPFPDDRFDAALCQMALMFFPIEPVRCARWPGSPGPAARWLSPCRQHWTNSRPRGR